MFDHTTETLAKAFEEAKTRYQDAGGSLADLSLEDLRALVAFECWDDGADFDVALETASMYQDAGAARHYLVQAFNY